MRPDIRDEIARLGITDPSAIAAKEAELEADWYAQYKLDRADAYPPLAEQLDKIYHEGIDAWKADIKAIKDKYPKPE